MGKKVDIIIPAYKAHKTIFKTLCSIAQQINTEEILVTIVNDCCPEGDYKEIIRRFKNQLDIQEIKLKKNGGPGVARQYGIDNTKNDYILFMDADDVYTNCFAVYRFIRGLEEQQVDFMTSDFVEEKPDESIIYHSKDIVWMFGKIYKRKFLEEQNIRFTTARANEDTCFNQKVILALINQDKEIACLDENTYVWRFKENSITRVNNGQYAYDQSIVGYIEGMIDVFHWAEKMGIRKEIIDEKIKNIMFNLYVNYCDVGSNSEIFQRQNFEFIKKFYNEIWKPRNLDYKNAEFMEAFNQGMLDLNTDGTPYTIFMAQPNIVQFMDMLENSPYNEKDIYKIWEELPEEIKQNNVKCGVVDKKYYVEKK